MRRCVKRAVSGLLILVLLLGTLPVSIHAANYDMFITNVRVSDDNKDDVLGDGVFSFDGDHTLTVRGSCETEALPIIASAIPDLLIRVAADCVLRSGTAPAIVANADLTIVGPGALELHSQESCGLYLYGCGGEIRNLSLQASGAWGIAGEKPDDEKEYLIIRNADVTAAGKNGAVMDFGGGITLEDCVLDGAWLGASAIEDAELKPVTEAVIRRTGGELPEVHAVAFHNARGSNPAAQLVDDGDCAKEPKSPRADGYAFTGWYTDALCRTPYDFSAPVRSDLHLYSGWEFVPTPPDVDKTALASAVELAEAFPALDFSQESHQAFRAALDRAAAVLDTADATQQEVDDALETLKSAVSALKTRDLGALYTAIAGAEQLDLSRYTDETAAALANTLAIARIALEAEAQTVVDAAVEALRQAVAALAEKPLPVDRAALEQAVAAARAVDPDRWTEESLAALKNVLEQATAALHAEDQQTVDAAVEALRQAVAALVEKPSAPRSPFEDVAGGTLCYDSVLWACTHEPQITNGVDETHFAPDSPCTRAQVVTFLWRANGCPAPENTTNPFPDVKADAFYCTAVLWAVEAGVTAGVDKTHFAPDQVCTRAQVVTFLWRAKGCPAPEKAGTGFTDVGDAAYYAKAVAWAVETGVTKGTDETHFSPAAPCTRGQVVTFLHRATAE